MSLLEVSALNVDFNTREGVMNAVNSISFTVERGETLGIVGESGSGKTVCCNALMRLLPIPPAAIKGRALFDGVDLLTSSESTLRSIRGRHIGMIFQDPMTALNPFMRIGQQIMEPLQLHYKTPKDLARKRALALLQEVGIDKPAQRMDCYAHELSGGMRQRVMIAMALITEPDLLIADEPTTALDVTTQAQILALLNELQQRRNIAMIFISHDLHVIKQIATRVLVLQKGCMVEQGHCAKVFGAPQHEYTQSLLNAIPKGEKPTRYRHEQPLAPNFLTITNASISFAGKPTPHLAVKDVSLSLARGEILGLVGESGCGKTSLAQSVVRLVDLEKGEVKLQNKLVTSLNKKALRLARKDMQMIFQDPFASLNPRMSIFEIIAEPLKLHGLAKTKNSLSEKVLALMCEVGLEANWAHKYPHQFSGGQRQRVAIARAIAVEPQLIIADEPVSALDVTIQAQILKLLLDLCWQYNISMIFISHDLAVVRYVADRIAVMQKGQIVELGNTEALLKNPQHHYTQTLLAARLS